MPHMARLREHPDLTLRRLATPVIAQIAVRREQYVWYRNSLPQLNGNATPEYLHPASNPVVPLRLAPRSGRHELLRNGAACPGSRLSIRTDCPRAPQLYGW